MRCTTRPARPATPRCIISASLTVVVRGRESERASERERPAPLSVVVRGRRRTVQDGLIMYREKREIERERERSLRYSTELMNVDNLRPFSILLPHCTSGKPIGRSISGRNMPEFPISTHLLSPASRPCQPITGNVSRQGNATRQGRVGHTYASRPCQQE
jgi:hypothetical protein